MIHYFMNHYYCFQFGLCHMRLCGMILSVVNIPFNVNAKVYLNDQQLKSALLCVVLVVCKIIL